jgi:sugar lactone lactonase YvrE
LGSYTETIAATAQTASETYPISGSGSVTITQTGCSISYEPVAESGLIGTGLTPSQLASLTRTGTMSGDNVSVTGLLALVDTVASAQAGFTVTDISSNVLNGSGQVAGNPPVITLNETGTFVASGTYSISGQTGSFTETITTSSTATFMQGGIITTVAGTGGACSPPCSGFSGDGGPATSASLYIPQGVAVDASGNLFVTDTGNNRIRKVAAPSGIITTVAGDGPSCSSFSCIGGFSGDGGPATSATLNYPAGIAVDASGNLFFADSQNNRIRKVSASGIITTIAGNGTQGFSGDGGPAAAAALNNPLGVAVDASGNLFFADSQNNRIRKVSASGIITTVAGNGPAGSSGGFSGDGGPATSAALYYPYGVAIGASGNIFIADTFNGRIRKVSASSGIISTVAGNGTLGFSGDGGPATSAALPGPYGVAVDVAGNLFISSGPNIYKVSASGIITTVAGIDISGFSGDGGPAISAAFDSPYGVALDASGDLFIADSYNNRIREVSQLAAVAPATDAAGRMGVQFKALAASTMPLNVVISLRQHQ